MCAIDVQNMAIQIVTESFYNRITEAVFKLEFLQ